MNQVLRALVLLSIVTLSLAADARQDPEVNGPFHLPAFEDQLHCGVDSVTDKFNVFSSVINLQIRCGGDGGVICGDSRRRWCSTENDYAPECVEVQPTSFDWQFSLPTDAEWALCLANDPSCPHADWVTEIPSVDYTNDEGTVLTVNCKPRDTLCPTVGTCSALNLNAVDYTVRPNFESIYPANWNSCGPDAMDETKAYYCTSESRSFCNLTTHSCQKDAYADVDSADASNFDFTAWNSVDNVTSECFIDMLDVDHGSLMMELKLWVSQYDERLNAINTFKTNLQAKIQEQANNIELRTIEDSTIIIKMPTNCPAPPEVTVPPAVLPCLGAAATARRISATVAVIDGKKADHQWRESLKNTNYKALGEITQCSHGQDFPCKETVLAHHPATQDGTLHCFIENKLVSDLNIDFKCFKNALVSEYYNEYKNFLVQTAQKWIDIIEEKVFPGKICQSYKYADSSTYEAFTSIQNFKDLCANETGKADEDRNDVNMCGVQNCCDTAEDVTTLVCVSEVIDDAKGTWGHTLTGGNCPETNECYIDDLELKISFDYANPVVTGEIDIAAESSTIVRLTQLEILAKLQENASDRTTVCQANTSALQSCGLTIPADDAQKFTSGSAHYCMPNECCQRNSDDNHVCITHTSTTSYGTTTYSCSNDNTEFWFNNDMYAKCLEDNQTYSEQDATQAGTLAGGEVTAEGVEADVSDVITANN